MRIALRTAAGFLALAFALPAIAAAEENTVRPGLHLGPVLVQLSLAVSETYNDNIYATAEETESDFFTTVTPGIELSLAKDFNLRGFTFGVNANTINASNFSELNRIDWELYGRGEFTIREVLTVEIGDTYTPSHIIPLESTSGELERFSSNAAHVGLKYDLLDLWQLRLGYTHTTFDYQDSKNRSRAENLIKAAISFRVLAKALVFLGYDFTAVGYDDSKSTLDNTKQNVALGATWEITEITKGIVSAGYGSVDFKDASEKGWSTWSASVDVRHELTELTTVNLKGQRSIEEGKYNGTRYLAATGISAGLTRQILERLAGNLSAGYFSEDFSDANPGDAKVRLDSSIRAGLGLGYSFRSWLKFDVSYDFVNRNSNIDHYDARVNAATIKATAHF